MKKVLYTDFEGVDNIISSMMDNPQLKKAVTRTNLMNFWDKILPQKFRGKSRPKIILLKKFEPYLKTLKMRVIDFKFDPKKWIN